MLLLEIIHIGKVIIFSVYVNCFSILDAFRESLQGQQNNI